MLSFTGLWLAASSDAATVVYLFDHQPCEVSTKAYK
jgi:hypothetical protein